MGKRLFYFGCLRETGHCLWLDDRERVHISSAGAFKAHTGIADVTDGFIASLDGAYLPALDMTQGAFKLSVVPPFRLISWHDFSVDRRPGSHSTFVGYGYASFEEMIDDLPVLWPGVMKRQPVPVHSEKTN